jgi:hypothetical protein
MAVVAMMTTVNEAGLGEKGVLCAGLRCKF